MSQNYADRGQSKLKGKMSCEPQKHVFCDLKVYRGEELVMHLGVINLKRCGLQHADQVRLFLPCSEPICDILSDFLRDRQIIKGCQS